MSSTTTRRLGVAASASAAALLALAPAAFAASTLAGADAQVVDVDVVANGKPVTRSTEVFNSVTNPRVKENSPAIGVTIPGRLNVTTGLVYAVAAPGDLPYGNRAFVEIHAPQVGITGVPTYLTSDANLKATCQTTAEGTPQPAVDVLGSIPSVPKLPGRNHTIYLGGAKTAANHEVKIVYNEQTTLPDGRLQVIGKHVTFNVKDSGLLGSGPVTGDVKLAVVTCGQANTDPGPDAVPVASPAIALTVLGGASLVGAYGLRRRRTDA